MDCKRIEDILPLYLEGSLSEEETREVERHLASCERCLSSYEEWRRCFSALQSVPRLQAPMNIWFNVKQGLSQRVERKIAWFPAFASLIGVSIVLVFLFLNLYTQHRSAPPTPPTISPPYQANLPSPTPPVITKAVPTVPKIAKPVPSSRVKREVVVAKRPPQPLTPTSRKVLATPKLEETDVEEKIAERLEMALLSAQQAESNLERAFQILRGKNLDMKGGESL
ncbi:zf-HC2 domain-containing protein [bacterium]|nr:zf-HC2 domain-containing protein [bacterium]